MTTRLLPHVPAATLAAAGPEVLDAATLDDARRLVDEVRTGGVHALRAAAERLGDLAPGAPLWFERGALEAARLALPAPDRAVLERTRQRIATFAAAQRSALVDLSVTVPGGRAGHTVAPVARAGCYAPGGRYPLPSSVLMTATTARVAGVAEVIVASPRPTSATLAAAAIAGADRLLACGGAHAIAALAYGLEDSPRCDVVVGPGNRFVTAAKKLVAGDVGIDMLAGPSELVVVADASTDPDVVAADLLGQAEHDPHARPVLIAVDAPDLCDAVEAALHTRLGTLSTATVARAALQNGASTTVADADAALALCDRLAPEHLQLMTADAATLAPRLAHYGALFVGSRSAEVFGDYGVGPNHVLPTGGAARHKGGLSVFDFLRVRTWLHLETVDDAVRADAIRLAELEGLAAHAAAAATRTARRDARS